MKPKNCIVVFGGAFNPPLNSHFFMAQEVLNEFEEVEKVIFVPVNKNYHKKGLFSNEHRYNMLKLITDKNDGFLVSDIDLKGERPLYTIEVLNKMQEQYKDKEICFLLGTDNLKQLDTWKDAEELLSRFKFLVMNRDNDNIEGIVKSSELLRCYKENIIVIIPEIRDNYSSTFVRSQIKKGKSPRYLMPDEVLEYIEKNKLYRGN